MPGTNGIGELRRLSGHRTQLERTFLTQQNAYQPGAQQNPNPIRQRFDDRRDIRRAVQRVCHLGENLDPPMFFAGGLGQARGFEKASELPREDSGFSC